jgi:glutathione S-transferase
MHSGFRELRMAMPMSLFRSAKGAGHTDGALADVARIGAIWRETREKFAAGGPFLFGAAFSNADAMFAPVVCRFLTYAPSLAPEAASYSAAVRAHPLVAEWYDAASREPESWFIERFEAPA